MSLFHYNLGHSHSSTKMSSTKKWRLQIAELHAEIAKLTRRIEEMKLTRRIEMAAKDKRILGLLQENNLLRDRLGEPFQYVEEIREAIGDQIIEQAHQDSIEREEMRDMIELHERMEQGIESDSSSVEY